MEAARVDVAVVGGGTAGVAAALGAAGCGARTWLIERETALGGNVAQALVHTICGLYLAADEGDARPAHPGLPERFTRALVRAGAAGEPERAGRVWVLPTEPLRLSAVAMDLCRSARNLELVTGAELTAAALASSGSDESELRLRDASGREHAISAAVVVDTTGDAALADLAGAATVGADGDEVQLPSYIFRLADVDTAALDELAGFARLRVTHAVAGGVRSGELPTGCEAVLVRPGAEPGVVYVTLNVPRPTGRPYAPLDPECVASLSAWSRHGAECIVEFLRQSRPAFGRCRVDQWPARIGIRETRRVRGRATISRGDILEAKRGPDEVAVSTWPIELWQDHRRARFEYASGVASVPLGALVSESHPRLGMAGRCLSADREALGALRVIGTALATGEAVGVAAAMAADRGVELGAVAPQEIRARIAPGAAEERS